MNDNNNNVKVLANANIYRNRSVILDKSESLVEMNKGIRVINELVTSTIGPYGRNIAILSTEDKQGLPLVTNDGVRVIEYALLALDHAQLAGARIVHSASLKTDEVVGDGTTSTYVLASSIIQQFTNYLEKCLESGVTLNRVKLRHQISRTVNYLTTQVLPGLKIESVGESELSAVATVSSGSSEVGELIGGLRHSLGLDGLINIRESLSLDDQAIYTPGYEFTGGFTHKGLFFGDDRLQKFDDVHVLIVAKPLLVTLDATTIINFYAEGKLTSPLFVISPSCQGQALEVFARNFTSRSDGLKIPVFPIDLPVTTDYRGTLQDLSALTGGGVVGVTSDQSTLSISSHHLGNLMNISTNSKTTQLVANVNDEVAKRIDIQVSGLQKDLEAYKTTSDSSLVADLKVRLSKLSGNSCTLALGGATSVERNERRMRYEDALLATHSAQKSGVVIGAGLTYLALSNDLRGNTRMYESPIDAIIKGDEDIDTAYHELAEDILSEALLSISHNVIENSGVELTAELVENLRVESLKSKYAGVNLDKGFIDTNLYRDLSVLDPYELVEAVIQNASSAAESFISTDNLVLISQRD